MTEFFRKINYWKMAWLRVILFATASGFHYFLSHTETWSDTTWNDTGPFLLTRLAMGTAGEMILVVIAFLDQSIARIKNGDVKVISTETK